nr:MAG TPA: hypothetical protein [Caudoviricetes sp.]
MWIWPTFFLILTQVGVKTRGNIQHKKIIGPLAQGYSLGAAVPILCPTVSG